jgi:uncharacterized membrane protein
MNKEKTLWLLFGLQILLTLSSIVGIFKDDTFNLIVTYLPLALLVLHACRTLTARRGLTFILLAGLIGWAAEAISLHCGTLFGGEYIYLSGATFAIWAWLDGGPYFGVPIGNFVGWFVVTVLVTGLFRLFEYYKPQQDLLLSKSIFLLA